MNALLLVAAWLVSSALAYRLFVLHWTLDFDYRTEDRLSMVLISLMPGSLLAALVVWLLTLNASRPSRVIKRRRSS